MLDGFDGAGSAMVAAIKPEIWYYVGAFRFFFMAAGALAILAFAWVLLAKRIQS